MRLLALAGGSASGKTTLARALEARLGCPVLHLDEFFWADEARIPSFISSAGTRHPDRNHPDAFDVGRVLAELERLRAVHTPCAVLEGNFALAIPVFWDAAEVRVFVDLEPDVRLSRKLLRNTARGQPLEQAARFYLENARSGHAQFVEPSRAHADLTVRGDAALERLVPLLARLLNTG